MCTIVDQHVQATIFSSTSSLAALMSPCCPRPAEQTQDVSPPSSSCLTVSAGPSQHCVLTRTDSASYITVLSAIRLSVSCTLATVRARFANIIAQERRSLVFRLALQVLSVANPCKVQDIPKFHWPVRRTCPSNFLHSCLTISNPVPWHITCEPLLNIMDWL